MQFPGFSLTRNGQVLLAKVQAGATLTFTRAAAGAGELPPDDAPFAALANSATATIVNSEPGAASQADVSTGFAVTELVAGAPSTAEQTSVVCLAAANLSGGDYFTLSSPHLDFYVWFTIDGVGADPAPANRIGIQVDVAALDSALTVAAKLATAVDHFRLDMADLYALIDERQSMAVQTVSRVDEVVCEISTVLTNAGLASGYYLRELGVFATDPDDGEILYAVTNAGDQGDYFPAEGGATLIESELKLRAAISASAALSMSVAAGAYASLAAFVADQQRRSHKEPCRAATTANITLSGTQTVDGVALAANDRVLVKAQTAGAENGVYLAAAGAWTRAQDFDAAAKIAPGLVVPVAEGTQNKDSVWQLSTDGAITLDTTALAFVNVGDSSVADVGQVIAFAMDTPPQGYLECDGAAVSRTTYARLFGRLSTLYGVGDGTTTFNLPDLRGEFVRGWDHGRGIDAARAIGTAQADRLKNHDHWLTTSGAAGTGLYAIPDATFGQYESVNNAPAAGQTISTLTHDGWSGPGGSDVFSTVETRPRNVAMLFCIKY